MIAHCRAMRSSSTPVGAPIRTTTPELERNLKHLAAFYVVVVSRYAARAALIDFKKYSD
jgi:hypothetical protein